ncbi:MAG: DNA translocase FtsK [Candidatus Pacebacteria bacterium CG_4_10_14_0_8_um_filter_43_12]|nr:MAG: DNA translocase FtsK [Candidatus Pacebacteria bacterium CG10_big_fil_rev_8_21_14_0_10_44_11]PIY79750.1 MAG: DNA translocase FtsK [Candidatus Pacebacteria bacterium CG_4_10_14_0_8_um_filter_43_12]
MGRRRKKFPLKLRIKPDTLYSLVAILLLVAGALVVVSFSGEGVVLSNLNQWLVHYFGLASLFLPFVFVASGLVMFQTKWAWSKPHVLLGSLLIMFGIMGLLQTGEIGQQTFDNLGTLVTGYGSVVIFAALTLAGILILTQLSIGEILEWLAKGSDKSDKDDADQIGDNKKARGFWLPKLSLPFAKPKDFSINQLQDVSGDADDPFGTAVAGHQPQVAQITETGGDELASQIMRPSVAQLIWDYPPLSLLEDSEGGEADRGDVKKNAATIEYTLKSFGIQSWVREVNMGPSVTQYALEISHGTKLSKVTGLATDLALALAAPTGQIRVEAPIAGKSLVGIEVPNYTAQYVTLRKILSAPVMKKHPSKLATALGINVAGQPIIMDIAKMPHVLIAGATGSGKSVAINSFMMSILFRASPAEVKFILVDPKRVELTSYNDIPHLLVPVIVEPKKVLSALKWATKEMDERYKQLAEVGVKNINGYNELAGHVAMPNIVIVIDELADIMLYAPAEVEECVTRIAQMARAVGIHLVLATQRPSVDIITGLIKANIPARIAFNVSSMMDSRVILDNPGAEKLLGRGDMLFIPPDQAKPIRIQGTYVSDLEIRKLIDYIKSQGQAPQYEEDITSKYASHSAANGATTIADERDDLFAEAAQYAAAEGKGSSSMIQRRFSVGYNRAARILDQLHAAGMVGPQEGSKPREVYTTKVMEYLRTIENSSDV